MSVQLRPAAHCRFDAVALGEVMLRLDPGEGRIRTARQLQANNYPGDGRYSCEIGPLKPRSTSVCAMNP